MGRSYTWVSIDKLTPIGGETLISLRKSIEKQFRQNSRFYRISGRVVPHNVDKCLHVLIYAKDKGAKGRYEVQDAREILLGLFDSVAIVEKIGQGKAS